MRRLVYRAWALLCGTLAWFAVAVGVPSDRGVVTLAAHLGAIIVGLAVHTVVVTLPEPRQRFAQRADVSSAARGVRS